MPSEAKKKADKKYRSKSKQLALTLGPNDQDIVEWLDAQPNKAGYIKALIRADMEAKRAQ